MYLLKKVNPPLTNYEPEPEDFLNLNQGFDFKDFEK